MKVTLELYDDQSCYDAAVSGSSVWIIKLNGQELAKHAIVNLETAHKIVGKLLDIEDLICDIP